MVPDWVAQAYGYVPAAPSGGGAPASGSTGGAFALSVIVILVAILVSEA